MRGVTYKAGIIFIFGLFAISGHDFYWPCATNLDTLDSKSALTDLNAYKTVRKRPVLLN